MHNKYVYPFQISFILEKTSYILWTSNKLKPNHYILYFSNNYFYMFNLLLNNELHTNTSTLTEATAIDSKYINSLNFNKSYLISVYSYYLYSSKIRLSILTNSAKNS